MRLGRWSAAFVLLVTTCGSLALGAPARAAVTANDPGFPQQWGMRMIGAPQAWQVATGAGVTIAVVDTGIDATHEDLAGKVVGAVTCINTRADERNCKPGGADDNHHGTHVAGIAAALTGNHRGVVGVAPDAKLLSVKVLDSSGSGTGDDVIAGIHYAIDNGAKVINLSVGSDVQALLGPSFAQAINDAWNRGVLAVVAAGNNTPLLPSGFGNLPAIVVGAVDSTGNPSFYSNRPAAQWSISAPGGVPGDTTSTCQNQPLGVLSTYWTSDNATNGYACDAGTSMAAPHVSGAAALLFSMQPAPTPDQVVHRLLDTAHKGAVYGAGVLDVAAAAGQPPTAPPGDTVPTTAGAGPGTPNTTANPNNGTTAPPGDNGSAVSTDQTNDASAVVAAPNVAGTAGGKVTAQSAGGKDDIPVGPVAVAAGLAGTVAVISGRRLLRANSRAS